jgi:hypothetical protein
MKRKHQWLAAQAVVTAALLALIGRNLDFNAFGALFVRLPLWFYLVSLAAVVGGQLAYAWRWRILLTAAGVDAPFGLILRQYFIGIFLGNFLPSTVGGDLAKVYYLGRQHGYRVVTASVVLDRLLGIALLASLASAALWARPAGARPLALAHVAVGGIAVVSFALMGLMARGTGGLPERVGRLGTRAVNLATRLQRLRFDIAAPLRSPAVILQATLVVAGYFIVLTGIYMTFVSIQSGFTPSFVITFGVVSATSVLSNMPVSINGLGLREQVHALLLAPLGVSREIAVAISLLLFGHVLIASLLGLVFWLQSPVMAPASEIAVGLEPPGPVMS